LLLCTLLCPRLPAGATQPPELAQPAADADFEASLKAADAKAATITDLSARFEQTKKTAMLRRPLVSSGTVRTKGTATRWDTEKPHVSAMRIDESQIRVYYPDQKTLETFDVDVSMRRITATPLPRLDLVREQFSVSRANVGDLGVGVGQAVERYIGILLTPKEESLRKHVERVRVVIERSTGCATTVEIVDADGDTTVIAFTDVKTNTGIADADLNLTVPEGTKLVKPLDGLGRGPEEPAGTSRKSRGRP
jgi:outer membrane lipoprotein-sorting protein